MHTYMYHITQSGKDRVGGWAQTAKSSWKRILLFLPIFYFFSFDTFFCPAGEASNLACVVAPSHCALLDLHAWHALCNHTVPARDVRRQGGDAHKLSTRRELRDSTLVMVKAAIIDVTISLRCGTPLERHRRRALVEE